MKQDRRYIAGLFLREQLTIRSQLCENKADNLKKDYWGCLRAERRGVLQLQRPDPDHTGGGK
ncbi:hypothetical protein SAMN05443094_10395 [Domibacillus enclensis]|uniref:Uncharacterized protein n=1 Tax=Domibacillus enclensis TaxID=1017273 RepID=A0A1N6TWB8_9BACI|nr:hypothetical protein SAMN05443094_10395 [Domibacillus enclensis]